MGRCRRVDLPVVAGLVVFLLVLSSCHSASKSSASGSFPSTIPIELGLRGVDVPGGPQQIGTLANPTTVQLQQLYGCMSAPAPSFKIQRTSPLFRAPSGFNVYSTTQVFLTSTEAATNLTTVSQPAFPRCASTLVSQVFSSLPLGTTFGSPTALRRTFPKIADGSVSYRLTMAITTGTTPGTATADIVFVRDQTAVVELVFIEESAAPTSTAELAVVHNIFPQ